jgi:hypothetical protein
MAKYIKGQGWTWVTISYPPVDRWVTLAKPRRPVIVGINEPAQGETLQELNNWRAMYGMNPVVKKGVVG